MYHSYDIIMFIGLIIAIENQLDTLDVEGKRVMIKVLEQVIKEKK